MIFLLTKKKRYTFRLFKMKHICMRCANHDLCWVQCLVLDVTDPDGMTEQDVSGREDEMEERV